DPIRWRGSQNRCYSGSPFGPRDERASADINRVMPSRLRDREQPARGVRGPVLGIVALCAVLAGYIAWQPQGVFVANTVDDIAEAVTALLAAVASALAARRSGGSVAKAWALLAAGTGAWAVGQVLTCWYEIGRPG